MPAAKTRGGESKASSVLRPPVSAALCLVVCCMAQVFSYTQQRKIMTDDNMCVQAGAGQVVFARCDSPNLEWEYSQQVADSTQPGLAVWF